MEPYMNNHMKPHETTWNHTKQYMYNRMKTYMYNHIKSHETTRNHMKPYMYIVYKHYLYDLNETNKFPTYSSSLL